MGRNASYISGWKDFLLDRWDYYYLVNWRMFELRPFVNTNGGSFASSLVGLTIHKVFFFPYNTRETICAAINRLEAFHELLWFTRGSELKEKVRQKELCLGILRKLARTTRRRSFTMRLTIAWVVANVCALPTNNRRSHDSTSCTLHEVIALSWNSLTSTTWKRGKCVCSVRGRI